MGFLSGLIKQLQYGDYEPVTPLEQVYAEKNGAEAFTLSMQLLKGKDHWVLRLDLNRRWGSTGDRKRIDLRFAQISTISAPFQRLLHDVQAKVTEPNGVPKLGLFGKAVMSIAAGKIVRSYGLINAHPRTRKSDQVEMFLAWSGKGYWLLLLDSGEWTKWPVGIAEKLCGVFPQLERKLSR